MLPPELLRFEPVYTFYVISEEAVPIDKMPILVAAHDVCMNVARLKANAN